MLPETNQPRGEGPLWRLLAGLGRGLSGEWRPVHSPGIQYDAPPEPTALGEAEIVEGDAFQLHEVGDAETSGFEFSLDGIEMTRVSGYVGFIPIVHGYVAAVIRQRAQGSFTTWAVREEEVLAFPFNELDPKQLMELGVPKSQLLDCTVDPDGLHPIRLAEL
ncbi:MAG: hypothetical protein V3T24_12880, partial [Longimicrobiales bacterium]